MGIDGATAGIPRGAAAGVAPVGAAVSTVVETLVVTAGGTSTVSSKSSKAIATPPTRITTIAAAIHHRRRRGVGVGPAFAVVGTGGIPGKGATVAVVDGALPTPASGGMTAVPASAGDSGGGPSESMVPAAPWGTNAVLDTGGGRAEGS